MKKLGRSVQEALQRVQVSPKSACVAAFEASEEASKAVREELMIEEHD